jgi:cysteine desulfurase
LYINAETKIPPFIQGGAQERNMRGGTENLYGIVGMAKALELAHTQMADEAAHLRQLKSHMIARLKAQFEDIRFNGLSGDLERSTHTVLNVSLPASDIGDMLLFNLDIHKISASGGSACSSGSEIGSHVLRAIQAEPSRPSVRFSFSRYTTLEEVDYTIDRLAEILSTAALS